MDRRAQWLRGVLDLCVLGALVRGESYGYEIAQRLEEGGLGTVAGGTLYPALLRLERLGLLATDWRPGSGGPARKYYRLSDEGFATLRGAGADWAAFVGNVDTFLGAVTDRTERRTPAAGDGQDREGHERMTEEMTHDCR